VNLELRTISPCLQGVQSAMRKIEAMLLQLEQELERQMFGSPAQPNLAEARQLLETLTKQLDQAIIFDKTIRADLERQLESLRELLESAQVPADQAKQRLMDFRNFYQKSFGSGQIV
jgi:chromosome segregation ATPase